MSQIYTRITDVRGFLAAKGVRRVRDNHSWKPLKRLPWPYCQHCGLLLLKNDVTARAAAKKCITEE